MDRGPIGGCDPSQARPLANEAQVTYDGLRHGRLLMHAQDDSIIVAFGTHLVIGKSVYLGAHRSGPGPTATFGA